jgi:hypothetical protein
MEFRVLHKILTPIGKESMREALKIPQARAFFLSNLAEVIADMSEEDKITFSKIIKKELDLLEEE